MRLEVQDAVIRIGGFEMGDLSFKVEAGECVALMGPSGCGKTTLVEVICGMRDGLVEGKIEIDGEDVMRIPACEREIGLVPQDVLLFPGMTVGGHLEFGLRIKGWKEGEIRERVSELSEGLMLDRLLDRRPGKLSGGEARRVALGRALAGRPRLLCLDEALAGLDEQTYEHVAGFVRSMIEQESTTVLHVTHSRFEAEVLAHRILEMPSPGGGRAASGL